jgi:hypothetical protein
MSQKILFEADIADGYSLRNTIGMLKNEINEISLIISASKISISFINQGRYAWHEIEIAGSELSSYHYHITDADHWAIVVSTAELFNVTKMIGRKDGIKISLVEGLEKLSLQPVKSRKESGQTGPSYVNIINKEGERSVPVRCNYADPNVKIQNQEFADVFNRAGNLKCKYMELIGYNHKMMLNAILPDGTCGLNSYFDQGPSDSQPMVSIKIPLNTVKTLSKLHNISPHNSLLKFSFYEKHPVKIESKIGTYGTYIIYLRDSVD